MAPFSKDVRIRRLLQQFENYPLGQWCDSVASVRPSRKCSLLFGANRNWVFRHTYGCKRHRLKDVDLLLGEADLVSSNHFKNVVIGSHTFERATFDPQLAIEDLSRLVCILDGEPI
jgi:hypothetical protein